MDDFDRHHSDSDVDAPPAAGTALADLLRLHPRLLLAAGMVVVGMFPVGLFLAAIGVGVLELSGGAAPDTGIVVAVAGYVVADFWGGGLVAVLTRARAAQVAVAWSIARLPVLLVVGLVSPNLAVVLVVQLALAAPASWAGARVARKQAALRRQIRAERATAEPTTQPDATPAARR